MQTDDSPSLIDTRHKKDGYVRVDAGCCDCGVLNREKRLGDF